MKGIHYCTAEKLYEPLRLAQTMGLSILLEPYGMLTDSIEGMQPVIHMLGAPDNLGVNMDTGNSWLGGDDPAEMGYANCLYRQLSW